MSTAQYAFAFLSATPMRAEPTDRSEMVNVVLFGEAFEILEPLPKWIKIRLQHDGYEGWIDAQMCTLISQEEYERIGTAPKYFNSAIVNEVKDEKGRIFSLTKGACFPGLKGNEVKIGQSKFYFQGPLQESSKDRGTLIETALTYTGSPYLWGGRTTFGIDCSGFTQMVYRINGIYLPRDASEQAKKGTTLSFLEECQQGDLAFFDNAEGNIIHVGIILEDFKVIHASGHVRIDKLDHSGIYNEELGKHTHKLRVLKTILD
ncbi:MAG TPA: hydrolase Nlp/P60 [Cryomorphaceae bacterium]|nr:hydrolase Nlp/P60 [Cryomorphaceae bacterium]|tara:strand:- start:2904 stop:3686 length:783 start_codon:yes stop_codon:yes gene_type:complete